MARFEYSVSALVALVAACGGSKGPPPPAADSGAADARPAPDALVNVCTDIEESYASLGDVEGTALISPIDEEDLEAGDTLSFQIALPGGDPADVFFLELWSDSVPFDETGFQPVSLSLNGDQSDLALCGACSYIAADYVEGEDKKFHVTYSGMLTIDEFDPTPGTGRLKGRIENLKTKEVDIPDASGQVDTPGGCRSEFAGFSFDLGIEAAPAKAGLVPLRRTRRR